MPFTELPPNIADLNLVPERLVQGDDDEFIDKMNSYMSKIEAWTARFNDAINSINDLGREIEETDIANTAEIAAALQRIADLELAFDSDQLTTNLATINAALTALGTSPEIGIIPGLRDELDSLVGDNVTATEGDFTKPYRPLASEINALGDPGDHVSLPWLNSVWRINANLTPEIVKNSIVDLRDFDWRADAEFDRDVTGLWSGTSNKTRLEDAIDQASFGDTVLLPRGDAMIHDRVSIRKGIHLKGAGAGRFGTRLIARDTWTDGQPLLRISSLADAALPEDEINVNASHVYNQSIEGIYLDGNGRVPDAYGLDVADAQHIALRDIEIRSFKRSALWLSFSVRESCFINVQCRYSGSAGYPQIDMRQINGKEQDSHNNLWFYNLESCYGFGPHLAIGSDEEDAITRGIHFFGGLLHSGPSTGSVSVGQSWYGYDMSAVDVPVIEIHDIRRCNFFGTRIHSPGATSPFILLTDSTNITSSVNLVNFIGCSFGGMLSTDYTQPVIRNNCTLSGSHKITFNSCSMDGKPSEIYEGSTGTPIITDIHSFPDIPDGDTAVQRLNPHTHSSTADRPDDLFIGQQHFDDTIGKPIWWDGTNWIDSAGTTV